MKLTRKQKHMISETFWAVVGIAFTTGFFVQVFLILTK